jgi:hypothetical protein
MGIVRLLPEDCFTIPIFECQDEIDRELIRLPGFIEQIRGIHQYITMYTTRNYTPARVLTCARRPIDHAESHLARNEFVSPMAALASNEVYIQNNQNNEHDLVRNLGNPLPNESQRSQILKTHPCTARQIGPATVKFTGDMFSRLSVLVPNGDLGRSPRSALVSRCSCYSIHTDRDPWSDWRQRETDEKPSSVTVVIAKTCMI